MSSIISNLSLMQSISTEIIRGRHLNYSQQSFSFYVDESIFNIQQLKGVVNRRGYSLKASLIKHNSNKVDKQNAFEKCILFLHGLGSSRLEGLPLVQKLPAKYCLVVFDFSGNGKSQGDSVTYGCREKQDLDDMIQYLWKKFSICNFVLWGRSMGAVATLLYIIQILEKKETQKLAQSQKKNLTWVEKQKMIKSVVIDSPFYDFVQVTKHIAMQKVMVPQFVLNVVLHFIYENFEETLTDPISNTSYNPFQIKFDKPINTKIPAVFLCSQIDEIVPIWHSQQIMKNYKGQYEKIVLNNISHNQQRPPQVIEDIFQKLNKFDKKRQRILKDLANKKTQQRFYSYERKRSGIFVFTPSKDKHRPSASDIHNVLKTQTLNKNFPISPKKKIQFDSYQTQISNTPLNRKQILDNKNYTDETRYFKYNNSSQGKKSKKIFQNRNNCSMNQTCKNQKNKEWQNIYQTLSDQQITNDFLIKKLGYKTNEQMSQKMKRYGNLMRKVQKIQRDQNKIRKPLVPMQQNKLSNCKYL